MKKIASFFLEFVSDEWVKEFFGYVEVVLSFLAIVFLIVEIILK